jgi:hypothetical protein
MVRLAALIKWAERAFLPNDQGAHSKQNPRTNIDALRKMEKAI